MLNNKCLIFHKYRCKTYRIIESHAKISVMPPYGGNLLDAGFPVKAYVYAPPQNRSMPTVSKVPT